LVNFLLVPVAIYLLVYVGRLPGEGSWFAVFVDRQRDMWDYSTSGLAIATDVDPYSSPAWSWPLLQRPKLFFHGTSRTHVAAILAVGNPLTWWASILAVAYAAVRWFGERRWIPEGIILMGVVATYVPWFFLRTSPAGYLYYMVSTLPFMYLALGYAADRLVTLRWGRAAILVYAAAVVAVFVFLYPILVGSTMTYDAWSARMMFEDCRDQAPNELFVRGEVGERPPRSVEPFVPGHTAAEGWCWI
jgi:dolichyl-phosphate-mannose--protein O-mannosyl transferase